jgi:thioredoxin reductase
MSAAIGVSSAGFKVIVLDLQPAPGGQVFRGLEANLQARPGTEALLQALGPTYTAGDTLLRAFRATPNIDYRPETTVWDLRPDGTVGWLKGNAAGYLRAKQVVLACGAMERPVPFPGWTLPGVMTAGAVQTLLKAGRLKPSGDIVLAGTGPLIFLLAEQLRQLGVKPKLIARTDSVEDKIAALPRLRMSGLGQLAKGLGWMGKLRLARIPVKTNVTGIEAHGVDRIESVSIMQAGKCLKLPCSLLIVHDGIVPSIDLAHCAGLALKWTESDATWIPTTSDSGHAESEIGPALVGGRCNIYISGDARRIGGADAAIAHGRHAANTIVAYLQSQVGASCDSASEHSFLAVQKTLASRAFIDAAFPRGLSGKLPEDDTIVCRCEEVRAGEIRHQMMEGATDINHIRGVLRCGMGPCQGRSCASTVARLLNEPKKLCARPPQPFRSRPPIRPLPLIALANLSGRDPLLAPLLTIDEKPAVAQEDGHA